MTTATFGTANEDNAHLSKSESKTVRRRSLATAVRGLPGNPGSSLGLNGLFCSRHS